MKMGEEQPVVYIFPLDYKGCNIPPWMFTLLVREAVRTLDEIYRGKSCGISSINIMVNRFFYESEKYIKNEDDIKCLAKINHDLHFNVKRTSIIHPYSFFDYLLSLCLDVSLEEVCEMLRRALAQPDEVSVILEELEEKVREYTH